MSAQHSYTESAAILALAERLRVSASKDRTQEMQMVMNRVAYSLQAIAGDAPAQAAPAEPAAWTNASQLEYLKDRNWSEIPMAMWAKPSGSADIPLYTAAPRAVGCTAPERIAELQYEAGMYKSHYELTKNRLDFMEKKYGKIDWDAAISSTERGCICQDQHRRGYCTEPGCPYAAALSRPQRGDGA